jgi:hypothetical protein
VACSQDIDFSSGSEACFGWKKQHKFAAQCDLLATRALWWGVLQQHHIEFDPHRFEEAGSQKKSSTLSGSKYVQSLVPTLIANLSRQIDDTYATLEITSRFAMTFGLRNDLAAQKYIEFLLSPIPESPVDDYTRSHLGDIRRKLYVVEVTAKSLLRRIESPLKRASILRSCTIYLEKSNCGTDYERLSLVFALYQEELGNAISQEVKSKGIDPRPFVKEFELTDRRRDALAILSSYFQGERKSIRPLFSSFFLPLNGSLDSEAGTTSTTVCRILGRETKFEEEYFDPLDPLDSILRSNNNVAAATALAPLCLALGVPRGFIHARSLVARFRKSESEDMALPSFESDVLQVINRLNASTDKADLAEWCSARYDLDSEDRLKCLDLALKHAMQASNEAERFGGKGGVKETEPTDNIESKALERVKRIRSMADMFADRSTVNAILRSGAASAEKHGCLTRAIDALIQNLETEVWCKHEFLPEEFIDIFLSQASLIAAEASLNGKHALSMRQFRNLSMLVHESCKSIADKYSHVQVGSFVRRLTRRWLFHGDHHTSAKVEEEPKMLLETRNIGSSLSHAMEAIDEDDTMNFVMDLTNLGDDDNVWSADIGTGPSSNNDARKLTSEEEPSSLRAAGSARESSELESCRVALRIAFVMAFAEGYYSTGPENVQDENSKPAGNLQSFAGKTSSIARGGLLGRIVSRGSQSNDAVMDHSKELLQIVFAKSGSSDWIDRDLSTSLDTRSFEGVSRSEKRKIITFAMRHRALRAASILCPQEALEEVATAEGYIGLGATCTLKKCSFGVFVAKEIEEMGLPLPHSDLTQLSTMHFPSYARTLWRYHRDSELKGSKGRLLLLILEMYLKEKVTDAGFIVSIFTEMGRLNLPRTILLACENIGSYKERYDSFAYSASMEEASSSIAAAMASLSNMVLSELRGALENDGESAVDSTSGFETVYRLGTALQCFCDTEDGQKNLLLFTEQLLKVKNNEQLGDLAERVCDQVVAVLRRVKDKTTAKLLMEQVNALSGEGKYFSSPSLRRSNLELFDNQKEDIKSLSGALARLESSLDNFTHSVV